MNVQVTTAIDVLSLELCQAHTGGIVTSHRHRRHPLHLICFVVQVQNLYLNETIEVYGVLEGEECAQARTPLPRVPLSEQS